MALTLNPSRLRLTTAQWFGRVYRAGAGSVTSVDGDGGTTGLTLTGGPIVTTGTLTLGGVLDPSAGGTGATDLTGLAASSLLINTTAPLAGGGDLTTDRTLSIAITPADDGGAVALQAATPGTQQTGHLNISGTGIAGRLVAGTSTGSTEMIYAARTVNDGNWAAIGVSCTDTATGSQVNVANSGSDQGQLSMVASAYAGTGSTGALAPRTFSIYSSSGASGGIKVASGNATAGIEFYTAGVTSSSKRMSIDYQGTVTIGYGWTPSGFLPAPLRVRGDVEITSGSGGGYKFADGSVQYTAVGVSGSVPTTRLINTTLPLSGGGDLSADRTLAIAITPTNDGGAVALQAVTPGTVQTGNINIASGAGFILADSIIATTQMKLESNTAGILEAVVSNTDGGGGDHTVCSSNTLQVDNCTAYTLLHNDHYTGTGARQASSMALLADANATAGISIAAQASAPIRFYTGGITSSEHRASFDASGNLVLNAPKLTAGTMTQTAEAYVRKVIHRYDWTTAMVVGISAGFGLSAGDITVCTLPAKTVVTNVYVVITTAETFTGTLTVAVGRTLVGYVDYIVASDAKAAANTVYGDAVGERGTNLTGYDLPSFTGTTLVKAHFIAGGGKTLDDVLASAGSVYIETMLLP